MLQAQHPNQGWISKIKKNRTITNLPSRSLSPSPDYVFPTPPNHKAQQEPLNEDKAKPIESC